MYSGKRSSRGMGLRAADERSGRARIVISSFDNLDSAHYAGGGAAVVEQIARWLAPTFDVTVVTASRRSARLADGGVKYQRLAVGRLGPRASQLLFHLRLPLAVRRIPHELWIESFTPPFSTSFLPLFSKSRVLGFAQNLSGVEMWRRYRIPFFLIERIGLMFYRDVVVLNPVDGETIRRSKRPPAIHVIPNGVELPTIDDSRIGAEHILFLGRIDIWPKGLDLLLAAYEKSGLTTPLVIAGYGTASEEKRLKTMLATAPGDVRWIGRVAGDQKRELIEKCSMMVLPSRHEPFGLSALEALGYSKPVVHFDLPSLTWIGPGGLPVERLNVSALAEGMRTLMDDPLKYRELCRAARLQAERFTPDQMADRHISLVKRLVSIGAISAGQDLGAE